MPPPSERQGMKVAWSYVVEGWRFQVWIPEDQTPQQVAERLDRTPVPNRYPQFNKSERRMPDPTDK